MRCIRRVCHDRIDCIRRIAIGTRHTRPGMLQSDRVHLGLYASHLLLHLNLLLQLLLILVHQIEVLVEVADEDLGLLVHSVYAVVVEIALVCPFGRHLLITRPFISTCWCRWISQSTGFTVLLIRGFNTSDICVISYRFFICIII